jgi:protein TonB
MKKAAVIILALSAFSYGIAQDAPKTESDKPEATNVDEVFLDRSEVMPEFPGGEIALFKYISKEVKYPKSARKNGIEGIVYATFVIDENGSIIQPKIKRGIGGGCDEEVLRMIAGMPKWAPGMQDGEAVKVSYTLPVKFSKD